jgi:hypothetical protein
MTWAITTIIVRLREAVDERQQILATRAMDDKGPGQHAKYVVALVQVQVRGVYRQTIRAFEEYLGIRNSLWQIYSLLSPSSVSPRHILYPYFEIDSNLPTRRNPHGENIMIRRC